jgi:hypothetical protein
LDFSQLLLKVNACARTIFIDPGSGIADIARIVLLSSSESSLG